MVRAAARSGPRTVTILGSTGSVGCSTIDLIEREPEAYAVQALTANGNVELLADQARRVRAKAAVVADESRYDDLKAALRGSGVEAAAGASALAEAGARPAEWVMAAVVGFAGLAPTLAAARRGAIVALANKEALVCAGEVLLDAVKQGGGELLPVDSEHNAIYQVFDREQPDSVEKLILTASGGPFRNWTLADMAEATPKQAVAHPNWSMGSKISVDSATLMNKGLELIEASYLFGMPGDRIDIVVHPQSVVHSLVAYRDGSVLAQLGAPDMRTPIAYALGWPRRIATPVERLNLATVGTLTFEAPDPVRFPALRLTRSALQMGGISTTILNAANEIAVDSFLKYHIKFLDIARIVEATIDGLHPSTSGNRGFAGLEGVVEADRMARAKAVDLLRAFA